MKYLVVIIFFTLLEGLVAEVAKVESNKDLLEVSWPLGELTDLIWFNHRATEQNSTSTVKLFKKTADKKKLLSSNFFGRPNGSGEKDYFGVAVYFKKEIKGSPEAQRFFALEGAGVYQIEFSCSDGFTSKCLFEYKIMFRKPVLIVKKLSTEAR